MPSMYRFLGLVPRSIPRKEDKPVYVQRSVSTVTFFCYISFMFEHLLVISQIFVWQQELMCTLEDDFQHLNFKEDRTP